MGCREAPRGSSAEAVLSSPPPRATSTADAALVDRAEVAPHAVQVGPGAVLRPAGTEAADAAASDGLRAPDPLGGAWVTCYGNFRPKATPERDVTRLGLLCGPANGMRLVGATLAGEASDVPTDHHFTSKAGECFRVFAVADAQVADLAVEIRDAKGLPVASDHNSDRYPIVNPDGPFCLLDAGPYTLRVHARKGRGAYALQLWRLP
jgi:hypothetical protein